MTDIAKWIEGATSGLDAALKGECPNDNGNPCALFDCAWIGRCKVHELTKEDRDKMEEAYKEFPE